MSQRRVNVYMPTFNGGEKLLRAVRSIVDQTASVKLVVVDNGSTDDSVHEARREFEEVAVVALGSNIGFGPALNCAVEEHPADVLVFTNNDVEYERHFVETMLDEVGSELASVAGVLLKLDDPFVIDSAGVIVDKTLLALDYLHGCAISRLSSAAAPLGPTGGAALVPHTAFSGVGGFDNRIFAYLEDVDLALRLKARGVPCRLASDARGLHHHSATLRSGSRAKNALMGWSRGYMLRRYGVLADPARSIRALASECVICAGQLVVDRTVSGISGRVRGWRAARKLPRHGIPPEAIADLSLAHVLRARAARRRTQKWS